MERREGGRTHILQPVFDRILHFSVGIEGGFQIPHEEFLAGPVGRHDQLAQQFERQPGGRILGIFHDDLGQHHAGEILTGFGVHHLDLFAFPDERSQIGQVYVSSGRCVVKAAVRVFFDQHGSLFYDRTLAALRSINFILT